MMYARHRGMHRPRYTIRTGRRRLTTWKPLHKGSDGDFTVDGVTYLVDAGGASHAMLSVQDGDPVAMADGIGRAQWVVHAEGRTYTFERTLDRWWEQILLDEYGEPIGVIRRAGRSKRNAEADLPGMSPPVAVFTIAVVLTMWKEAAAHHTPH